MRLIDADILKEAFIVNTDRKGYLVADPEVIIDNAPTVEAIPTELHEKIMDITTGELLECQSNLRSQGEWIDYDNTFYKCPECGYLLEKCCPQCQTKVILPICHCGADMRPKPNQLRDCENCIHHSENGCEVWECEFKRRSS